MLLFIVVILLCTPAQNHEPVSPLNVTQTASQHRAHGDNPSQTKADNTPVLDAEENSLDIGLISAQSERHKKVELPLPRAYEDELEERKSDGAATMPVSLAYNSEKEVQNTQPPKTEGDDFLSMARKTEQQYHRNVKGSSQLWNKEDRRSSQLSYNAGEQKQGALDLNIPKSDGKDVKDRKQALSFSSSTKEANPHEDLPEESNHGTINDKTNHHNRNHEEMAQYTESPRERQEKQSHSDAQDETKESNEMQENATEIAPPERYNNMNKDKLPTIVAELPMVPKTLSQTDKKTPLSMTSDIFLLEEPNQDSESEGSNKVITSNDNLEHIHSDTKKDNVIISQLDDTQKGKANDAPNSKASPRLTVEKNRVTSMISCRASIGNTKPKHRVSRQAQGMTYLDYTEDGKTRNTTIEDNLFEYWNGRPHISEMCICGNCKLLYPFKDTGISLELDNIALGRKATASRSYGTHCPACAINNGMWDSTNPFWATENEVPNFCYHSASGIQYAWIEIDLESVVTFSKFILTRTAGSVSYKRLVAVQVLVDGRKCYEFPRYGSGRWWDSLDDYSQIMKLVCSRPMTGRYFRIQKAQEIPINTNAYQLVLCEVSIYVCKKGTYGHPVMPGKSGCGPCPSTCRLPCNNYDGCEHVVHDVGIKKAASQNSIEAGAASNAVNGIPYRTESDCTKLKSLDSAKTLWWRVSLEQRYSVFYVNITALPRNARRYLTSVNVWVTLVAIPPFNEPVEEPQLCHNQENGPADGAEVKMQCATALVGRHVSITSKDYLGFCEVRVFGRRMYWLPVNTPCNPQSEYITCSPKRTCDNTVCKTKANEDCENTGECVQYSVCEFKQCKVDTNQRCKSGQCRVGTVCDAPTGKCKLDHGQNCTDNRNLCLSSAVCDTFNRCGIKVGQRCNGTSQCTAGAACDSTCQCQHQSSEASGATCSPKSGYIGSACNAASDCRSSTCENSKCVCSNTMAVFLPGLSCKHKAGVSCSQSGPCNTGMDCENGKCKINVGETCEGNEGHCKTGLVCDVTKICKKDVEQPCLTSDECKLADTCSSGKCKIVNGKTCPNDASCVSGLCSSQDNSTCRFDTEGQCSVDTAHFCHTGSFCEQYVCKLKLGEQCTSDAQCQRGTVCSARGSSPKQCRWTLGHGCEDDTDCEQIATCDNLKQCRISKSEDCSQHPHMCLIGGVCSNGTCLCNEDVTQSQTDTCDPEAKEVGGTCVVLTGNTAGQGQECNDEHARCVANVCQCTADLVTDSTNLECRLNYGSACTTSEHAANEHPLKCISGAVCDVMGICAVEVGGLCEGRKSRLCKLGTSCDTDSICRIDTHQSCTDYPTGCRNGTVCDILKRCKYPAGERCREDRRCEAGSYCSLNSSTCQCTDGVSQLKGGTCLPLNGMVGGECNNSPCEDLFATCDQTSHKCECKTGYAAISSHLSCAKSAGEACVGNKEDDKCTSGLTCDPADKTCRIQLGEKCDGDMNQFCITGAVCDYNSVCMLDLKGNCRGDNRMFCKSGTLCDWLGQCSTRIGDTCSPSQDVCPAGAICFDSKCVCDPDISTRSGAICHPLPGRFKSTCQLDCGTENYQCVKGVCECVEGAVPDKRLACGMASRNPGTNLKFILIGISGLAAFCAALIGVFYWRQVKKETKRDEIIREGTEDLKKLRRLSSSASAVINIQEPDDQQKLKGITAAVEGNVASTFNAITPPAPNAYETSSSVSQNSTTTGEDTSYQQPSTLNGEDISALQTPTVIGEVISSLQTTTTTETDEDTSALQTSTQL